MKSLTTQRFWDSYNDLPKAIQQRAQEKYALFTKDHSHPSLRFKKVHGNPDVYSVRITQDYRALGEGFEIPDIFRLRSAALNMTSV